MVVDTAEAYDPREGDRKVMEFMVYADANKLTAKNRRMHEASRSPSVGSGSPRGSQHESQHEESDSDDDIEEYSRSGVVLSPTPVTVKAVTSPRQGPSHAVPVPPPQRVLKKPFFKNWEDFLDFDISIKHRMPITLSEFALLAEKESESIQGWDVCVDRKEIKVVKVNSCVNPPIMTLRAWATVPGADIYAAFYQFYNMEQRCSWDKVFATMNLIEKDIQGSEILYSVLKAPAVTPRDFLQYRRIRVMEDGTIHIVLRSAEHHGCPENKANIRAESYISGYILRQEVENGEQVLKIFLMAATDVKGFVPKWVVNYLAPKAPPQWVDSLRDVTLAYQKSHPNVKEELADVLQRFREYNSFDYEELPQGAEHFSDVSPTPGQASPPVEVEP
jgi:hypothetical protein